MTGDVGRTILFALRSFCNVIDFVKIWQLRPVDLGEYARVDALLGEGIGDEHHVYAATDAHLVEAVCIIARIDDDLAAADSLERLVEKFIRLLGRVAPFRNDQGLFLGERRRRTCRKSGSQGNQGGCKAHVTGSVGI